MERRGFHSNERVKSKFEHYGDGVFAELIQGNYVYPHQLRVVQRARDYFSYGRRSSKPFLIKAPTGSGKTGMICLLPYALKCPKVLILSPSPSISDQIGQAYKDPEGRNFFVKTGIFQPADLQQYLEAPKIITRTNEIKDMNLYNMVIVNAQKFGGNSEMTLLNRDHDKVDKVKKLFENFTTIIVDEAHHYPAPTWKAIIKIFENKQIIFLTATPNKNGTPIIPTGGDNYIEIPKADVEGVYIRKCAFHNMPGINQFMKEFSAENFAAIQRTIEAELDRHNQIMPDIPHKALILVTDKYDAELLENNLNCVDGRLFAKRYNSDSQTSKYLDEFQRGEFPALIVCGKLLEGYDNPDISVCVIFRKVQSSLLFAQFIGRCLRMSNGHDRVTAQIFSATPYGQEYMWKEYEDPESVAENDPEL